MSFHDKSFAIIPARGGSKRLKRKNCLFLHGKPLIAWSIMAALESCIFTDVFVSTDDDEIADIALQYGALILERPIDLADDISRVDQVCLHHLQENQYLRDHEFFFCLYPTAPLRNSSDLLKMDSLLRNSTFASHKPDGVYAVSAFGHYPFQALYSNKEGFIEPFWPAHILKKGSDFPDFYAGNGSTYALSVKKYLQFGNFSPLNYLIAPYEMPQLRSIDVDTVDDFNLLKKITKADGSSLIFI